MKINPAGTEIRRAELSKPVQATAEVAKKQSIDSSTSSHTQRSDQVQISDAGRALASQAAASASSAVETKGLTPERIAEIRGKILEGAYNSVEVVDQVARRMLEHGDI